MADTSLTLGTVTFRGFEIPERIPFGGEQALSIKKLVGGARVVDALGQDDDPITWSGRFQGPGAVDRALELDTMRRGGQQQVLTVFGLSYTVVVKRFTYDVERMYQVLYTISLEVVQDNTQAPAANSSTLDDLVGADMTTASGILPDVTDATIPPAMSSLQSAISAAGTLEGSTLTALAPVMAAAANASSVISSAIGALDPVIQSDTGLVAGIVAGGSPLAMVSTFQAQLSAIGQEASLQQLLALTSRIQTNLAQATG